MILVEDIIDYLKLVLPDPVRWHGTSILSKQPVETLSSDLDLEPKALSWISEKNLSREPNRIYQFKGTLLIGPHIDNALDIPLLSVKNPKLAFAKLANEFFAELSEIAWSTRGDMIHPDTLIGDGVRLAPGAIIGDIVIIHDEVSIGPNTVIANCVIHSGVKIGANCSIGLPGYGYILDEDGSQLRFPHIGKVIIGQDVEIGSNTCIDRGALGNTIIEQGAKIDNLVHIAHNVRIGENAMIIANTMLGGSAQIGANVWVAPSVSIINQATVGADSILGMGAVVLKDVEENTVVVGNPARLLRKN